MADDFKPALIVVDVQEDFLPPNGSLAVPHGRDTIPTINSLLALTSFVIRVATKDWHPADHISFAANHPGTEPFTSTTTITNPLNASEPPYESRLWPVHCVAGTPGVELAPELDVSRVDRIIEKGQRKEVEMYSAFYDPFKNPTVSDSGLAGVLKEKGVTHVYVVGLAADYCVKCTAVDAASEGFVTYIVEEGTRPVDEAGWVEARKEIEAKGVSVVKLDGSEVERLKGKSPLG